MIFEQTLTISQSIAVVTFAAVAIFLWRLFALGKKSLNMLTQMPSLIVLGDKFSGKTSLVKAITGSKQVKHPLEDGLGINYLKEGDKKLQVIDANVTLDDVERLKNLNIKFFIYVFDASSSDSFDNQIKNFEKIKKILDGVKSFVVLNKTDLAEKQTIKKMKDSFQDVYEVSVKNNEGLEDLRKSVLSSLNI